MSGAFIPGARHSQTARLSHPISDAVHTLNRLGHVVSPDGALWIDGQRVQLRVRNGTVEVDTGGTTLPFHLFAKVLRPVDRPSYFPRGYGKDGMPFWAEGPDLLPPRKDQRA